MEEHTSDLRNVHEGDDVTLTFDDGGVIAAHCSERERQNADPRSGEVRETSMWHFECDLTGDHIVAAITDGLKSSPDDPDFPIHNSVWNVTDEEPMGYLDDVKIHGQLA